VNIIKNYMKVGILIIAIGKSMAGLMGCNMARNNIKSKIQDNLKIELGEEFKVFWLQGSLFGTEYEANVSPVSNMDIRFTVYTDEYGKAEDFNKSSY
jgi:hypothetical protein